MNGKMRINNGTTKFEATVPTDGEFIIAYDLYTEGEVLDFLGRGDEC